MEWQQLVCLDSADDWCERSDGFSCYMDIASFTGDSVDSVDSVIAQAVDILGTATQLEDQLQQGELTLVTPFSRLEHHPVTQVSTRWLSGSQLELQLLVRIPRSLSRQHLLEQYRRGSWSIYQGGIKLLRMIRRQRKGTSTHRRRWLVLCQAAVPVRVPVQHLSVSARGLRMVLDCLRWKVSG